MDLIVAVDNNWAIGKDNDLLIHIKEDLIRFKEITLGSAIVMGKRTLLSFKDGKPLKGRTNIVLCFPDEECEGDVVVVHSIKEALDEAKKHEKSFVVGGESVYRQFLPYCEKAYITKIDHEFDADRFFPNLDELKNWEVIERGKSNKENDLEFSYLIYKNSDIKA